MTNLKLYNEFAETANLNKKHDPWRVRKPEGISLAMFEIVESSGNGWWYDKFVGIEFMGMIRWHTNRGIKSINEIVVVAMVKNVYMNNGRTIDPKHVIMM